MSNKRTLVRCEKLVVDLVGLLISTEVLQSKSLAVYHSSHTTTTQLTNHQNTTPTNNYNRECQQTSRISRFVG